MRHHRIENIKMITAIAVDDEPKAIKIIQHHASKIDNLNLISHFYNAKDALQFLKQNPVDLVFLDINMPNMSGIEMLDALQLKPHLIFTTAYTEYALDSYNYNAIDYLLKPFEFDRFLLAIHKVEDRLSSQNDQHFFFIKDGFKTIKIEFKAILYIKGSGNYLDITTNTKTYAPRMTFTDVLQKLPVSQFVRVHQSYIINVENITKIENNQVYIETKKIPISSQYKDLFLKRLNLS